MRPVLAILLLAVSTPALADVPDEDRMSKLQSQIEKLQAELDALKQQVAKGQPSWKGAPQWSDASGVGWSFKPRGRLQLDTGYIGLPDNYSANRNLGYNSRVRRMTLGAEGSLPGDFGYKIEVDFSNGNLGYEEVMLTYAPAGKPWSLRLGNQDGLQGLEVMSSSLQTMFLERAQFTDAFVNNKRLGAVLSLGTKDGPLKFETGLFAAHSIDASLDNDGWIVAGRLTYSPKVADGQLHFGANFQHREFQSNDNGVASTSTVAPSTNQIARYRARPFLQTTDVRFVDTGPFAAHGDDIWGAELAGVFGPFHFASEAQWTRVDAYRAGDVATGLDAFAGGSVVTPDGDPSFFGAYAEAGWFLTGETRPYADAKWGRVKVAKPLGKNGSGAWQIVARVDRLDLDSDRLIAGQTNNFATGASTLAPLAMRQARGGTQTGYLFGLNWYPVDYIRFMLDYVHVAVEGGPFAATAKPFSSKPVNERRYSTDAVALRAQVDF